MDANVQRVGNTLQRAPSLSCCYEGDTFAPELILVYVLRGTITPPDKSCDADTVPVEVVHPIALIMPPFQVVQPFGAQYQHIIRVSWDTADGESADNAL
jgi:hypothetical protein